MHLMADIGSINENMNFYNTSDLLFPFAYKIDLKAQKCHTNNNPWLIITLLICCMKGECGKFCDDV